MKKPYKYCSNILLGSALLGQTSAFAVTLKRVFSICIQYLSNISQLSTQEKVANLYAVWDRIPWGIIQKMCQFILDPNDKLERGFSGKSPEKSPICPLDFLHLQQRKSYDDITSNTEVL